MTTRTVEPQQAGLNCPYCRFPLKAGLRATACDGCGALHHEECWEENGGCAIVGCAGTNGDGQQPTVSAAEHYPEVEEAIRAYEAGDFDGAIDRLQLEIFHAESENDEDRLEEVLVVSEQMMGHLDGREEYGGFQRLHDSAYRQLWRVQNRTWSEGLVRARAALAEGQVDDALRFCREELRAIWEDTDAREDVVEVIRNLAGDLRDEARSRFDALVSRAEFGNPIGPDEDIWWTRERLAELSADDFAPPIIDALDAFDDGDVDRSLEMLQRLAFEASARRDETTVGEVEDAATQLMSELMSEDDRRAAERVVGLAARQRRVIEDRVWPAALTSARRAAEEQDFAEAYSLLEAELVANTGDRQAVERIASVAGEIEGVLRRGPVKASFERLRMEAEALLASPLEAG